MKIRQFLHRKGDFFPWMFFSDADVTWTYKQINGKWNCWRRASNWVRRATNFQFKSVNFFTKIDGGFKSPYLNWLSGHSHRALKGFEHLIHSMHSYSSKPSTSSPNPPWKTVETNSASKQNRKDSFIVRSLRLKLIDLTSFGHIILHKKFIENCSVYLTKNIRKKNQYLNIINSTW